jgi:preprotein translocase subunit SecG
VGEVNDSTDAKAAFKAAVSALVTGVAKAIVRLTIVLSALALVLMVLVHLWHNADPAIPAIGFSEALVIVTIWRFLASQVKSAK